MSPLAATGAYAREFSFADEDFAALRALVKAHTGIHLTEQKRELVYGRLARRLRALRLNSFAEYRALLAQQGSDELVEFCNAITTNLTSFFREAHHFRHLRENLLAPRLADPHGSRRIRIWSAGCSTGEEPYSLAMTVREALGGRQGWDIRILATDIDTDVLQRAERGIYALERLRDMDPDRCRRFFRETPSGVAKTYEVADELRSLITFRRLNLMDRLPMKGPLDAVFCRNVVIYFDQDTQRELFARIAKLQPPGALLFLGHSESLLRVSEAYAPIGKTIYRKS